MSDCVALMDHVKELVLGSLEDSVEDLSPYWLSLSVNLFVGAMVFIPALMVAFNGVDFAMRMCAGGSQITFMELMTMIAPSFIAIFVSTVCYLGMLRVFIKIARGMEVKLLEVLSGYSRIWSLAAAAILLAPVVALGLVCFVVPGLYVLMRAALVPVLIIDENAGPLVAIKRSFEATRDRHSDIFVLIAALVLANYFISAVGLMLGALAPMLAPAVIVPAFLVSQFLIARFHVTENPSVPKMWSMLNQITRFNRA